MRTSSMKQSKFTAPLGMLLLIIIGCVNSGWGTWIISGGGRVTVEGFTTAGGYRLIPE